MLSGYYLLHVCVTYHRARETIFIKYLPLITNHVAILYSKSIKFGIQEYLLDTKFLWLPTFAGKCSFSKTRSHLFPFLILLFSCILFFHYFLHTECLIWNMVTIIKYTTYVRRDHTTLLSFIIEVIPHFKDTMFRKGFHTALPHLICNNIWATIFLELQKTPEATSDGLNLNIFGGIPRYLLRQQCTLSDQNYIKSYILSTQFIYLCVIVLVYLTYMQ